MCYEKGKGCEKDLKKAFILYEKSAEKGLASAQYNCGRFIESALNGNKNGVKAFEWYTKSAEQGYPQAEAALGRCYYYSIGMMAHDYSKAYKWLKNAYEDGCKDAIQELGECYYHGRGVSKDYIKARELFLECESWIYLMECYYHGRGTEKDLDRACDCFSKTSSGGDERVLYNLGLYVLGKESKDKTYSKLKCTVKSNQLFERAANKGHVKSMYRYGNSFFDGNEINKDFKKGFESYKKAAEKGHSKAQYKLGKCYEEGVGIEKDKDESLKWYRESAERGELIAQVKLGDCYLKGKLGVEKNEEQAFKWYRKAADQGDKKSIKYCTVDGLTFKTYEAWKKAKNQKT